MAGKFIRHSFGCAMRSTPKKRSQNGNDNFVVLKGQRIFTGDDGQAQQCGPNSLLIFAPGENHITRALEAALVFVGFLYSASNCT
jgi:quercetin dioxygenase-like cupin family protein